MNQEKYKSLQISNSPHISSKQTTSSIMWTVSLALLPAALWGIHIFGIRALIVLLVSILSSVGAEALLYTLSRDKSWTVIKDGSAFLTGLLIGFNLPSGIPLYIPVVASVFAICVVKIAFGGLGANWMNPALAGRVFVFFSWSKHMAQWPYPLGKGQRFFSFLTNGFQLDIMSNASDTVTTATPLGAVKTALPALSEGIRTPYELLMNQGTPFSLQDLFWGTIPGCIGEISAFLLLIGALILIIKKILNLEIPLIFIGIFSLLTWIFGGLPFQTGYFTGNVGFHIFSGGLILGAFFMATDMATTPLTFSGRIIFAFGCGVMTFLIRQYGAFPEGVSLAIIFMNIFVPLIDKYIKPRKFGYFKKTKEEAI